MSRKTLIKLIASGSLAPFVITGLRVHIYAESDIVLLKALIASLDITVVLFSTFFIILYNILLFAIFLAILNPKTTLVYMKKNPFITMFVIVFALFSLPIVIAIAFIALSLLLVTIVNIIRLLRSRQKITKKSLTEKIMQGSSFKSPYELIPTIGVLLITILVSTNSMWSIKESLETKDGQLKGYVLDEGDWFTVLDENKILHKIQAQDIESRLVCDQRAFSTVLSLLSPNGDEEQHDKC